MSNWKYLLWSFVQLRGSSLEPAHSLEFDQVGVSSFVLCPVGVSLVFVQLRVSFLELCPIGSIFFGVFSSWEGPRRFGYVSLISKN